MSSDSQNCSSQLAVDKTCRFCNQSVKNAVFCPGCSAPYHPGCAIRSGTLSDGSSKYIKCCGSSSRPNSPTPSVGITLDDVSKIINSAVNSLQVKMSKDNQQVLSSVQSIEAKFDNIMDRITANEETIEKVTDRLDVVEGPNETKTFENSLRESVNCSNSHARPFESNKKQSEDDKVENHRPLDNNRQNKGTVNSIQRCEKGIARSTTSRGGEYQDGNQKQYSSNCTESTEKVRRERSACFEKQLSNDVHCNLPPSGQTESSVTRVFEVYFQNVRGLRTKLHDLRRVLPSSSAHMFVFTETWLHAGISTSELGFDNFSTFRCDRNVATSVSQRGGGVLLSVNNNFPSILIPNSNNSIEVIFVRVNIFGSWHIFGVVYLPPNSDITIYANFYRSLEEIFFTYPNVPIHILGDFNMPYIEWDISFQNEIRCKPKQGSLTSQITITEKTLDTLQLFNLTQLNIFANEYNSILDLILSNYDNSTIQLAFDSLLPTDKYHPPLIYDIKLDKKVPVQFNEYTSYNFGKADFQSINNYLSTIEWEQLFGEKLAILNSDINVYDSNTNLSTLIDDMINILYMHIYTSFELFIPLSYHKSTTYPPWFNNELKNLVKEKKIAHAMYKRTRELSHYEQFTILRAQYNKMSIECYNQFIIRTENNLISNPKLFWNYLNSSKEKSVLPMEMSLDTITACNSEDIANLFVRFFDSVYGVDDKDKHNFEFVEDVELNVTHITKNEILAKIRKLNTKKGPGVDGIPSSFMKSCSSSIIDPLFYIFNSSLKIGYFPEIWKEGIIVPIYKKGNKSNVKNYRPIVILNAIPKLFESIFYDRMFSAFESILIEEQHGFRRGRSTVTNLCVYTQYLTEALEGGKQVDAVYTDFSKAFDKVSHSVLISKLEAYGVSEMTLRWLRSYLHNRSLV
ncbi:uncharacterized protein LOC127280792, partial [Leptopilina boulardi]|uniref:uncharacterized protein LOC127280792 n=1 Tax=Leptopilina boulardi TaxID=63433 RepID=UPI0021F5DBC0